MEFDETPRFWCPRVALIAWINFAFSPDENLRSDFRKSEKVAKRRKNKNKFSSNTEEAYGLLSSKENELVCVFVFFLSSFCLSVGA